MIPGMFNKIIRLAGSCVALRTIENPFYFLKGPRRIP